jgi:hypothetical protein
VFSWGGDAEGWGGARVNWGGGYLAGLEATPAGTGWVIKISTTRPDAGSRSHAETRNDRESVDLRQAIDLIFEGALLGNMV